MTLSRGAYARRSRQHAASPAGLLLGSPLSSAVCDRRRSGNGHPRGFRDTIDKRQGVRGYSRARVKSLFPRAREDDECFLFTRPPGRSLVPIGRYRSFVHAGYLRKCKAYFVVGSRSVGGRKYRQPAQVSVLGTKCARPRIQLLRRRKYSCAQTQVSCNQAATARATHDRFVGV